MAELLRGNSTSFWSASKKTAKKYDCFEGFKNLVALLLLVFQIFLVCKIEVNI
jgi:hypothetical protein